MRIGSLFSGYGGLCELATAPTLGGTVAWHCEVDRDATAILTHHWPDTPNLGDITAVDWSQVEPVDVLTGGFPCQDLSHAGKRLGLKPGTRSGLWSHMAYAISHEAQRLLPTPSAEAPESHYGVSWKGDALYRPDGTKVSSHVTTTIQHLGDHPSVTPANPWGIYADAIAQWEALTRPAPPPTQPSKKGTPQLSPAFSEWMMGLPAGHVTAVPGLSRNAQLKALGNGVVPAQCALALSLLLGDTSEAVAA